MGNRPPFYWILVVLGAVLLAYGVYHQLSHMDHLSRTSIASVVVAAALFVWASRQRSAA